MQTQPRSTRIGVVTFAGVASLAKDTTLAPKGATGWGVMALNRLIRDLLER